MGRKFSVACLTASLMAAVTVPPVATPFAAQAQSQGDEKCTVSGKLWRYNVIMGKGSWMDTYQRCDPRDSQARSSTRDDDEDDDNARRSSRRSERNTTSSGGGRPEDGDEKCSPDGYVMKYSYNDFLKEGRWSSSLRRCTR